LKEEGFNVVQETSTRRDWKTKPSDRFILKWTKCQLSARITPKLVTVSRLRPWMVTVVAAGLGVLAGLLFALGWGFFAALIAALSQILDGVDGQLARLTGRESRAGAFMDSVVDRYADGALVIGLVIYLVRGSSFVPLWALLVFGAFALIGSNSISYSSARAESLGIDLGRPTLASKGTRVSVIVLSGLLTPLWESTPAIALFYLALHSNMVVMKRLFRAFLAERWG
jgi:CDP-diacylglycerol---glycerol-3-phosphate 3-phosphatidyltransferase